MTGEADACHMAIMLLGGDRSGQWAKWYRKAIPLADDLLEQHIAKNSTKKGGR